MIPSRAISSPTAEEAAEGAERIVATGLLPVPVALGLVVGVILRFLMILLLGVVHGLPWVNVLVARGIVLRKPLAEASWETAEKGILLVAAAGCERPLLLLRLKLLGLRLLMLGTFPSGIGGLLVLAPPNRAACHSPSHHSLYSFLRRVDMFSNLLNRSHQWLPLRFLALQVDGIVQELVEFVDFEHRGLPLP